MKNTLFYLLLLMLCSVSLNCCTDNNYDLSKPINPSYEIKTGNLVVPIGSTNKIYIYDFIDSTKNKILKSHADGNYYIETTLYNNSIDINIPSIQVPGIRNLHHFYGIELPNIANISVISSMPPMSIPVNVDKDINITIPSLPTLIKALYSITCPCYLNITLSLPQNGAINKVAINNLNLTLPSIIKLKEGVSTTLDNIIITKAKPLTIKFPIQELKPSIPTVDNKQSIAINGTISLNALCNVSPQDIDYSINTKASGIDIDFALLGVDKNNDNIKVESITAKIDHQIQYKHSTSMPQLIDNNFNISIDGGEIITTITNHSPINATIGIDATSYKKDQVLQSLQKDNISIAPGGVNKIIISQTPPTNKDNNTYYFQENVNNFIQNSPDSLMAQIICKISQDNVLIKADSQYKIDANMLYYSPLKFGNAFKLNYNHDFIVNKTISNANSMHSSSTNKLFPWDNARKSIMNKEEQIDIDYMAITGQLENTLPFSLDLSLTPYKKIVQTYNLLNKGNNSLMGDKKNIQKETEEVMEEVRIYIINNIDNIPKYSNIHQLISYLEKNNVPTNNSIEAGSTDKPSINNFAYIIVFDKDKLNKADKIQKVIFSKLAFNLQLKGTPGGQLNKNQYIQFKNISIKGKGKYSEIITSKTI